MAVEVGRVDPCGLAAERRVPEVWQLWEQAWQGAWQGGPAPVASSLPPEHHARRTIFRWQKHLPVPIRQAHSLPTQSQCLMHCHCLVQHHLGDHFQQMSTLTYTSQPIEKKPNHNPELSKNLLHTAHGSVGPSSA